MKSNQQGMWRASLGGPNALSTPAWLLTLPGAIVTPLLTAPDPTAADVIPWLTLGLAGHLVSAAVMAIGWLNFLRPGPRAPRPWTCLSVVILAGVARGLFIAFAAVAWGISESLNLAFRVISAPASLLLWFSIATLIVDSTRRHRATMQLINEQIGREDRLAVESAELIRGYRQGIVEETQRIVTEQLTHAYPLAGDPQFSAARLREVVDEVVRPLSRELRLRTIADTELLNDVEFAPKHVHIRIGVYWNAMLTVRPFRAVVTALIIFSTSIYLAIFAMGPIDGMGAMLAVAMLAGLLSGAARRISVRNEGLMGISHVGRLVPSLWLAISLTIGGVMLMLIGASDGWADITNPVNGAITLLTCVILALLTQLAVAASGATAALREQSEAELLESAERAEWLAARLRQQAYLEKRELSRVLHGEVQARIVSMALQAQINPPSDPQAAIDALNDQIRESLSSRREVEWTQELELICRLWADAITLHIDISPDAAQVLNRDPTAAGAMLAIVREAITNAVRHGESDDVAVRVIHDAQALDIRVSSDGLPAGNEMRPGLGTELFDAVCLTWDLSGQSPVVFSARITAHESDTMGQGDKS